MAIPSDVRWFKASEFRHPKLVREDAVRFLDDVREYAGVPIVVTSDARTAAENTAAGGSEKSWHLKGRAFDLRWPTSDAAAWRVVDAVFAVARMPAWRDRVSIELELVYSERDRHIHIAVKDDGSPSRLIVAAD